VKITDVRTRVVEWRGKTTPPAPHFCTNPIDLLALPADSMAAFRFHGWLLVEVFTDAGHVGLGNAALSPRITKQLIDLYLKPLCRQRPVRYRVSMAAHVSPDDGIWAQGGMVAISAVDIAIWDILGKATGQPVFRLLGGRTKEKIPVYAADLQPSWRTLPRSAAV
jgi:L-alanine-DL-glutamate epimerase-like enolase superfamily enzyme